MAKSTRKARSGKTWREKLERVHPDHGSLQPIPRQWAGRLGKGAMLIPRPLDVEAEMRRVRKGRLLTLSDLRARLARAAGADIACPLTTGIFVRIVAEAAEEDRAAGKKRITPYWRVVRDGGRLNEKFPGGVELQARRLVEEGFAIVVQRGVRRVKDFERFLAR